jgi:predicted kinase
MTNVCTILVGPPASGKSTWLDTIEWSEYAWYISTDSVIQGVAHMHGLTYDQTFKNLIKFAEQVMWTDLEDAAERGDPIYIDRTNMSISSRKKFIDFLKPYGYTFEAVVFSQPEEEEWERRLKSREGKTIPWEVINGMLASYEAPTEAEGFSKVTFL